MSRLYSIQYVRAFAALMVALYHFEEHLISYVAPLGYSYNQFKFIFYFGYTGVDFFFVISGFVIWLSTYKSKPESKGKRIYEFNVKRFLRIYLPYWPLILVLSLVLPVFTSDYDRVFRIFTLFPYDINKLPLMITWTLSFELVFYLCFSFLLMTNALRIRLYAVGSILFIIFGLNTLFAFYPNSAFHHWFIEPSKRVFMDQDLLVTLISPLILQFLVGIFTAHLWLTFHESFTHIKGIRFFKNSMLSIIALLFIAAWYFDFNPHVNHGVNLEYLRGIILGPIIALTIFSLLLNEKVNPKPPKQFLLFLGDGSYLIYLVHLPVYIFLNQYLGTWATQQGFLGFFSLLALYIFILCCSALFSRLIEIPLYHHLTKLFIKPTHAR